MKPADAKKLIKGIPIDSANNELSYWVGYAKLSNPNLKIAIKGDQNSNYDVFSDIIGTLQAQNINIFQLITSPEGKPK
jgi:biopolymer transport protein ExbD